MKKHLFHLPDGVIYLDGNSLGPLPTSVSHHMNDTLQHQWGDHLIGGWNKCGWFNQPGKLGDQIGALLGAAPGSIMVGDTLSIKVFQALSAALTLRPERNVILSDQGNFPTDLYMAQGLISMLDKPVQLQLVEPDAVEEALDESVAVMMLTQVDYRTGRLHDMAKLTQKAHEVGAVALWDLAHSAGAIEVDLQGCNPEFAAGCTYKYLNAGPGAPAFIYVRPDIIDKIEPTLSGWLGHDAPFDFDPQYRPAPSIERMRVGTPPVLQMSALKAALTLWQDVDMAEVRRQSIHLSQLFIELVEKHCPQLQLASPREPTMRGSQVSFKFHEGFAVIQALIEHKVIGDFRAPDIMRFGITPLYIDEQDIRESAQALRHIMDNKLWDHPRFRQRSAVT